MSFLEGKSERTIVRSAADVFAPTAEDFIDIWVKTQVKESLRDPNKLFCAQSYRSWFLRKHYPALLKAIVNDDPKWIQVIHGPDGSGKSVFLLYMVALLRKIRSKSVLVWMQGHQDTLPLMIYLKSDGTCEQSPYDGNMWREWLSSIARQESYVLVDGVATFSRHSVSRGTVRYVVAQPNQGTLGIFRRDLLRHQWLSAWSYDELKVFGTQMRVNHRSERYMMQNYYYIGGTARFVLLMGAGRQKAEDALVAVSSTDVLDFLSSNHWRDGMEDNLSTLVHFVPPPTEKPPAEDGAEQHHHHHRSGLKGFRYTFSSEYMTRALGYKLQQETNVRAPDRWLSIYKRLAEEGGFPAIGFCAYAIRKLAEGGTYRVRKFGTVKSQWLPMSHSPVIVPEDDDEDSYQELTLDEVESKTVWLQRGFETPAASLDAFSMLGAAFRAFQMVHTDALGLEIDAIKSLVDFFDRSLHPTKIPVPAKYAVYYCVPKERFASFVPKEYPFVQEGPAAEDEELLNRLEDRLEQWVLEIQ